MTLGRYFLGVVAFSVAINLIGTLYPSDNSGVRRALDICLSLCLLCAVIAPVGGMIADARSELTLDDVISAIPEADVEASNSIMSVLAKESEGEIEEKLFRLLSAEFDEEDIGIDVSVKADETGVAIEYVRVYLYGKGLLIDPRDAEAAVARYTDAECLIIEGRRE